MANRPTLQPAARVGDDPTTRRLRELAAQEAAATKERTFRLANRERSTSSGSE